jgi:hypothetical protein
MLLRIVVPPDPGGMGDASKHLALGRGGCSPEIEAPRLPVAPVAMVFEAACRQPVQMQHIGGVAPTVPAGGMASMQAAIGQDGIGRDDVARDQRGPELVEHLVDTEVRYSQHCRPRLGLGRLHAHSATSVRAALAGQPDPCVNPVAHLGFEPTDRTRTEAHGRWKLAVLDVLVEGAAREPGALLHLRAT